MPADPEDLLPADSILTLDEYLEMYAAMGHRTRYEISIASFARMN